MHSKDWPKFRRGVICIYKTPWYDSEKSISMVSDYLKKQLSRNETKSLDENNLKNY